MEWRLEATPSFYEDRFIPSGMLAFVVLPSAQRFD